MLFMICLMSSFRVPFSPIVLTYGSIATKASMSAMPSSNRCKILTRIFHSFKTNAKKVLPVSAVKEGSFILGRIQKRSWNRPQRLRLKIDVDDVG